MSFASPYNNNPCLNSCVTNDAAYFSMAQKELCNGAYIKPRVNIILPPSGGVGGGGLIPPDGGLPGNPGLPGGGIGGGIGGGLVGFSVVQIGNAGVTSGNLGSLMVFGTGVEANIAFPTDVEVGTQVVVQNKQGGNITISNAKTGPAGAALPAIPNNAVRSLILVDKAGTREWRAM